MKKFLILSFVLFSQNIFSQLEFTDTDRWLFTGSDSIDGKWIIAGCYISPIDSFHLKLEIDILDNWKQKDRIVTEVKIDTTSILSDTYKIFNGNDAVPSYRFLNEDGFEILIAKERHYYFCRQGSSVNEHSFSMSLLYITLPPKSVYYVKRLPLLHEK